MNQQHVIFVSDGAWQIGIVSASAVRMIDLPEIAQPTLPSRVEQLKAQLTGAGYRGQPVLLALPSSWCLSATISCDKLPRSDRAKSMAFRLEEHLPISAEEFVADYRDSADGTTLGVCAQLARLRELISAFESADIPVRHICPQALLAAAHVIMHNPEAHNILMAADQEAGSELIEADSHGPKRWQWFPQDAPAISDAITKCRQALGETPRVHVIGALPTPASSHKNAATIEFVTLENIGSAQAAALEGGRILDGATWPWIDLRRDELAPANRHDAYRKPLAALAATATLLVVCVSLAAQWRGRGYQSLARQQHQQQVDVFKRLFPDQRTPSAVSARLLAEQRKLAALIGQAGEGTAQELLSKTSSLVQLRDLLKGLPLDLQYQILELDFQPDLIRVEGRVLNHVDAERLTAALRQSGALDVDAPKTEALKEGGVSFAFVARPHAAAPSPKGAVP